MTLQQWTQLGVQCPVSQQRKRSTELFTPLSPSLTPYPPIITSSAVSAPAPGPACMTACYRDTPKPSSSRSSAADVTNPSHWRLAFVLSIYIFAWKSMFKVIFTFHFMLQVKCKYVDSMVKLRKVRWHGVKSFAGIIAMYH